VGAGAPFPLIPPSLSPPEAAPPVAVFDGWAPYTNGPNWGQTYTIDPWGNLTHTDSVAGKNNPSGLMATSANTQNQLTGLGMSYDAAGNVTHDNLGNNYTYDAENRIIFANGVQYGYDGDGKRIGKSTGTLYWTGVGSDALTETDLNGNPTADYFYFNGMRVGRMDRPSGVEHIYINDDLGTARIVATPASYNTVTFSDSDYSPYGIELPISGADSNHYKFTGKERDTESGLDNFGKRYYGSSMGRFMTTDPVVITTERLMNPQQLNLYAYVANNPLRFIDPTGEILQCVGNADSQKQCFADLQQIAGDAANRLSMDAKTGVVSFDTKDLDLSKNAGAALVNDLVGSKNTFDFSVGPTIMTDKGPVRIDKISTNMANLPTFGDQPQIGNPPAGVSDILGLNLNNPNMTRVSNTNLKVAPEWTVVFHELAEAYEKIDGGKGGSYAAGHNAALQRELELRDQRPYLREYNTGAGGPANSPNPQGGIIIKK
jgi:RHS repeat-associated protein